MIYINKTALERMADEVATSRGIETGGILVGVHLNSGDSLITHVTSPGPKAIKRRNFFQKDFNYTVQIFNVLHRKYSVDYLGEWHKHPEDYLQYSPKDRQSMFEITEINPRPCSFAIVGDSFSYLKSKNYLKIYTVNKNTRKISVENWEITEEPERVAVENGIMF